MSVRMAVLIRGLQMCTPFVPTLSLSEVNLQDGMKDVDKAQVIKMQCSEFPSFTSGPECKKGGQTKHKAMTGQKED